MKKHLALTLATLTLTGTVLADCREHYSSKAEEKSWFAALSESEDAGGVYAIGGVAVLAAAASNPIVLLAFPAAAGTIATHDILATRPYAKMAKLIQQSYNYRETGYTVPGKLLSKMYAQVENSDLPTFANAIIKGNEDGSLCNGIKKFKNLKQDLADGKLDFAVLEDAPAPSQGPVTTPAPSNCRVISQPNSSTMGYYGTANRDDAVTHFASKNGIQVVAEGVTPSQVPAEQWDYAIVESGTEKFYNGVFGAQKRRNDYFFDIVDNNGQVVKKIKTLTTRTRVEYGVQVFGNYEGKAIKQAMKEIKKLCGK